MRIPKRYGESKIDRCPFCNEQATSTNPQGVPACRMHRTRHLPDMKCACGSVLDLMHGAYGVFFRCMDCGTKNLREVLEINDIPAAPSPSSKISSGGNTENTRSTGRKEIFIRSDDPRYFD